MKLTDIQKSILRKYRFPWIRTARARRSIVAGVSVIAGGMMFAGAPTTASADTEFIVNGSFENNDGFNGNNVGFGWVSGNDGGSINNFPDPAEPAVFDVYDHNTQQYGGFDPDTFLGGDATGQWYFHTVGVDGLQADGTTTESPIVQQTVDLSTRPAGENFFSFSSLISGFGADTAQLDLTFWDAAGGISGGGAQVGSTYRLDGTAPNSTNSNLDNSAWANNAWSQYLVGDAIPAGTVSATVQILQATVGGGNQNDNYVDLVSLMTLEASPFDEALKLIFDRDDGTIVLQNGTGQSQDIKAYSIVSNDGALIHANWLSIDDNYDGDSGSEIDSGEWVEFSDPGETGDLSEGALGTGTIGNGASFPLSNAGGAWLQYYEETGDDLSFQYLDGNGDLQNGIIEFVGAVQTTPFAQGDLNFDGVIDALDWAEYADGLGADMSGMSAAQSYRDGDLNGDSANNHADFVLFKGLFEAANGPGSFAELVGGASIPEPSAGFLVLVGLSGVFVGGRGFLNREC